MKIYLLIGVSWALMGCASTTQPTNELPPLPPNYIPEQMQPARPTNQIVVQAVPVILPELPIVSAIVVNQTHNHIGNTDTITTTMISN